MQTAVLPSTALLTALMLIGLAFFIRASTKDRIQVAKLIAPQQGETLLEQIQQYFTQRAYRLTAVEENQVTFEGFVRPSLFLAIFLSLLAAIGLLCLALMLSFALPSAASILPAIALLSPIAGWFYWKKSGRLERVLLQVETGETAPSILTITAHRDELAEFQRSLGLQPLDIE